VAGLATAEAGVKFFLNPKFSLYVGGYIDYGFNNISKNRGNRFFEFDPENIEMVSNSVLTAQYARDGRPATNFTYKVSPLSFGLTVRMGINTCPVPKREKASKPAVAPPMNFNINVHVNCNHNCRCCEPCEKQDSVLKKLTELVLITVPSRKYTPEELAEYDRATKEYGELEDLLILQLDGYYTDQTNLTPIMKLHLDTKITQLQKYNSPEIEIICEGHTCNLGSASYNMTLGRKRAEEVRKYLITNGGFSPNNVRVVSKGLTTPIVENFDETHRKINRRVVFLIKRK
jgi:outer membrane protein OmpA-like peptidoglycan-associated protein